MQSPEDRSNLPNKWKHLCGFTMVSLGLKRIYFSLNHLIFLQKGEKPKMDVWTLSQDVSLWLWLQRWKLTK